MLHSCGRARRRSPAQKSQIEYDRFACLRSKTPPPRFALAPADSELCPRGGEGGSARTNGANECDGWRAKVSVSIRLSIASLAYAINAAFLPEHVPQLIGHSATHRASQPVSLGHLPRQTAKHSVSSRPHARYTSHRTATISVSAFVACQKDALETKFVRPSPRKMSGRTAFV